MSHQDDTIPIEPSERRRGPARPLDAPRFDAGSVRRARAAVPLEDDSSRWDGRLPWVIVALVAGMIGGLLGIWALSYYSGAGDGARTAAKSATTNAQPAASPAAAQDGAAAQPQTQSANDAARDAAAANVGAGDATAAEEPAGASPASTSETEELRGALAGWIEATNARDVERQMNFYDARVGTFYLARDASREAVRAEKASAFARATRVDVRADAPQITLSADGRTATMRFRKQYAIEGGGQDRRGAVLQELRWRRTPRGWKIVGERDLRVVD